MNTGLLWTTALIYTAVGINYARERNYGLACTYVCYAVANIGILYSGVR